MIKDLISRIREKCASLYVGLILNIVMGVLAGVVVYMLTQLVTDFSIRANYASEENTTEREKEEIAELQALVTRDKLSTSDLSPIAEWATDKRYVYLMLYRGDRLIYTSDLGIISEEGELPASSEATNNFGLTVDHPSNATLRRYAQNNAKVAVEFSDGVLYASVVEFSEYLHYDIINVVSIALALGVLAFFFINYFRRMIKRIRNLEADVTIVTHSSMEHRIASRGHDEIGKLSANVENMRHTILENLQREREALDANTELITAMSHDIRTPLTVMLGYLEMMKTETQDLPALSEYVEATERTAMRLKHLSDDMFKYSLAFGDATEGINMEQYDAGMLFEQMLSEHVLLLRENEYEVIVENHIAEVLSGATVITDAQNLMRIIDNVFSNARKYADKANPVVITVKQTDGGRMMFECSNTVRTDEYKAESNKIGLKTCKRLAGIIADGFEYGTVEGKFVSRLKMHIQLPQSESAEAEVECAREADGVIVKVKNFTVGVAKKIGGLVCSATGRVRAFASRIFCRKRDEVKPAKDTAVPTDTHIIDERFLAPIAIATPITVEDAVGENAETVCSEAIYDENSGMTEDAATKADGAQQGEDELTVLEPDAEVIQND